MGDKNKKTNENPFLHLTHSNNQWVLREAQNKNDILTDLKKEEALKKSIEYAKSHGTELVIHKKDGKIQDRRSYGNDPRGRG